MAAASLRKFQPSGSNPWDRVKAAHLLNRAGFGGTPEQVTRVAAMRPEAAVEELLAYEQVPESFPAVDYSQIREMVVEVLRLRRDRADEGTAPRPAQQLDPEH